MFPDTKDICGAFPIFGQTHMLRRKQLSAEDRLRYHLGRFQLIPHVDRFNRRWWCIEGSKGVLVID
jgi:hypothetical protein